MKINGRAYTWGIHRCHGPNDKRGATNHLYRGTFDNLKYPMCRFGWSNAWGFSIFRGPHGTKDCLICIKNAENKSNVIPKNPYLKKKSNCRGTLLNLRPNNRDIVVKTSEE